MIHFEGQIEDEAALAFRDSVDSYLALCAEMGDEPEVPAEPDVRIRVVETAAAGAVPLAETFRQTASSFCPRQMGKLGGEPHRRALVHRRCLAITGQVEPIND